MKGCIHINLDGRIMGKQRPRFGNGRTYTPSKTRAAESVLAWEGKRVMGSRPLFKRPIDLYIAVFVAYPKSWSKKAIDACEPFYTGKPDADNQLKLVADAFNGIVWEDDSQISVITLRRSWWHLDQFHIRVEEL